ncbi:hypothetical protein MPTK1_8g00660 [Marchantia polymorpha subsp. ruderalis]|uniref:Glycosyltransferase family 92 protein n=1 Tax=Marchantia polymorpha TaxID=3197 RepID=A0A2R6WLD9_MARPO|nr:hypothetical protein MARPO_0077s0009 [Marchantia polymorpha]BBN18211.1 hypothetical protein Mp_8g00660 [Marchantia polymorpha subsp. ruderalis]|eukprot:PTQ34676.1 hypothetical protein MARPO_0077s0009 [Marchantia polymorpha]
MGWSGDEPVIRRERSFARLSMEHVTRPGGNRKLVDSVGCTLWWVKRVCFSLAAIGFLLTVSSVARETFSAALFYPRKLVSSQQQLRLNYLRVGQEFQPGRPVITTERQSITVRVDANKPEDDDQSIRVKKFGSANLKESLPDRADEQQPYIEDMISLPERLDLFLVRQFLDFSLRDRLTSCKYGDSQFLSKILNADFVDGRLAVTCLRPAEFATENFTVTNVTIEVDDGESGTLRSKLEYEVPARWDAPLVYAVVATKEDVILFVKGVFDKRKLGDYSNLHSFKCVFGRGIETEVTSGAQEVYRCVTPKFGAKDVLRQKVYLRYQGHLIPSVAYYDRSKPRKGMLADEELVLAPPTEPHGKKHLICSCTMVWNSAKFLKEWVLYNSHLGVEKFFLYDNNSEDDIEPVVALLHEYNVTRHLWPWVKTQEAGFSHCIIRAQRECVWVLFADVDEYVFPKHWLPKFGDPASPPKSPLAMANPFPRCAFRHLIEDTLGKVILRTKLLRPKAIVQTLGQVSIFCRNFGPSGLTEHPPRGVTQGYTCRDQREQRHKSLVLLSALKPSIANVIHHFELMPEYTTMYIDPRHAVINHYKFQAWSEFETKFTKRASTYVVDWKEPKNLNSRDRPDGVGPEGRKPENWEHSHCFMNDTALRDYTRSIFEVKDGDMAGKLEWELL